RLHEEDPTGHLLQKNPDAIMHYCLPAEVSDLVKPPELKQKYVNGLMDPIRMSAEILEQEKINLGSYGYSGQFDQDPAPAKGKIWQKWFTEIPDNLFPPISELEDYGSDWDTAFGEKEENAASAYITSGIHKTNKKMYIDDLDFRNLEFPDLINWMLTL